MDWIALSFVQRPEDVAELKKIVAGRAGVLAKIEKPKALASLDGILELADALMVARGDLGVEMPLEAVPGKQKYITRAARKAGKPVVVATQMLESMISSPMPSELAPKFRTWRTQAVFDGADAVMLSGGIGLRHAYPEAAVRDDGPHRHLGGKRSPLYHSIIESQRAARPSAPPPTPSWRRCMK